MIYLGEQMNALIAFSKEAVCWLTIKLKGRLTKSNPLGYCCGKSYCIYCNSYSKKRSGIDQDFRNLFTNNLIQEIIISKPNRLIEIFKNLRDQYIALPGKTISDFKKYGKKLFVDSGYENWFLKERKNYWLAKKLSQHTCTYCNREYIFVYKNRTGGKGMIPQFDHWFAKSDYPILALSFYNLIPSCATCNTIKSAAIFNLTDHLHPYMDKTISSSYIFSFLPITPKTNKIVLKNNNPCNQKGLDTVKILNLPLIFEGHSNKELQDLIDLKYKYSDNYLNILLNKTFGNLNISDRERYRLIFGIEIEEDKFHKRPLSKFKKDILKELDIID